MTSAAPRRRWFAFSLRTLFGVLTTIGVCLAWAGVQLKWIHDRHEAQRRHSRVEIDATGQKVVRGRFSLAAKGYAPLSLMIFGEPGYASIFLDDRPNVDSTDLVDVAREIHRLFPEAHLEGGSPGVPNGRPYKIDAAWLNARAKHP